jgi:hypothetical protein
MFGVAAQGLVQRDECESLGFAPPVPGLSRHLDGPIEQVRSNGVAIQESELSYIFGDWGPEIRWKLLGVGVA